METGQTVLSKLFALQGLRGLTPKLGESQSMDNIYIGTAMGLFALVLAVIILVRQLVLGVGRQPLDHRL